jgi:hypothetical protein
MDQALQQITIARAPCPSSIRIFIENRRVMRSSTSNKTRVTEGTVRRFSVPAHFSQTESNYVSAVPEKKFGRGCSPTPNLLGPMRSGRVDAPGLADQRTSSAGRYPSQNYPS